MPPSNFFGLRHGTSPRSITKCAGDARFLEVRAHRQNYAGIAQLPPRDSSEAE
jgi:hypothetical protein